MTFETPNYIPEIPGVLDDLAARLQPVVEPLGFRIVNRPSPEGRPVGRGEIYLALDQISYQQSRPLPRIEQRANVSIGLVIRYFDPRSQVAAYEVMSAIRKSLVGYTLPNSEPLQIDREFFAGSPEDTGAWEYRQVFEFESSFLAGG